MVFGIWHGVFMSIALGSVGALITYIARRAQERRNMNQNYQVNSFPEREEQVNNQRNIICTFCNIRVQRTNDHRLPCGHRCHESCYQKQPVRNRNCTYCRDENEEATTSSVQSRRRSSISNECCYCKLLIQSSDKTFKLNCKHSAHQTCYDTFNGFMQCQACNLQKFQQPL